MKTDFRINESIYAQEIRVIDSEELNGIYRTKDALELAYKNGKDLIEVSTGICKIQDYNKFLYQEEKKDKEKKKKTHQTETKEIRLGLNISDNDLSYRIKQARQFLIEKDKVKLCLILSGREIKFKDNGELVVLKFAEAVSDVGVLEQMPKWEGKRMICTLKPKKLVK